MNAPLLEIKGLFHRYTALGGWVLQDVDLAVRSGEVVCILGVSGAGKSTLVRCANRLVEPLKGDVRWKGESVLGYNSEVLRAHRRRVGMVFQEFNLIEQLNVVTNVLVGGLGSASFARGMLWRFPNEQRKRALHALERVGLGGLESQSVRRLSGGQRQRVAIARTLVQGPELLLGDEPVSSLDPATAEEIMQILASLNREEGLTLLLNLHSVALARRYAHRVLGLAAGRIVFDGSPRQLDNATLRAIYGTAIV
jgi:phosphonate transport system ATP-binding protein